MRRRFLPFLLIFVSVGVFVWGNDEVRGFCAEATYPFRRMAGWVRGQTVDRFGAAWRGLCDGPARAGLDTELERLQVMLRESERVAAENATLREALGWAMVQKMRVQPAPVWSHGGGLGVWPRLTLGVGSTHGVAAGDTVVVPEGLVGRVAEGVSLHTCEVILISDPACRIAAEIPGVTKGIVQGAQGIDRGERPDEGMLYSTDPLLLRFVGKDIRLQTRQTVQTEGSGGIFPQGLIIGVVIGQRLEDSGLLSEVLVEPAADPALLGTVFVLTKGEPPAETGNGR